MFEFAAEEFIRHFRLHDIVNAGAAAAPGGFRQLHQFQIWNRSQDLSRLRRNFLPMTQVTGFVVRHGRSLLIPEAGPPTGFWSGRLDPSSREPLVDVLDLLVPEGGALA